MASCGNQQFWTRPKDPVAIPPADWAFQLVQQWAISREIDDFMLYDQALSATDWSKSTFLPQDSWASSRIGWFPARVIRTTNSSTSKTIASVKDPWTMKHNPSSLFVLKLVTRTRTVQQALTVRCVTPMTLRGLVLDNATIDENAEAGKIVGLLLPEDVDSDSTIFLIGHGVASRHA